MLDGTHLKSREERGFRWLRSASDGGGGSGGGSFHVAKEQRERKGGCGSCHVIDVATEMLRIPSDGICRKWRIFEWSPGFEVARECL